MSTQFVNSMLSAKATVEVNEQVQKELDIPDPTVIKALATITNLICDDDAEEDVNGEH